MKIREGSCKREDGKEEKKLRERRRKGRKTREGSCVSNMERRKGGEAEKKEGSEMKVRKRVNRGVEV